MHAVSRYRPRASPPINAMNYPEKSKIGAPTKEVPKKKISITVDTPLLSAAKEKAASDNESLSQRVERALALLDQKESRGDGRPRGRGFKPNR